MIPTKPPPHPEVKQEENFPGDHDVICGRGKVAFQHPGNRRLRTIIKKHLEPYSQATSRMEKTMLVSEIMEAVRSQGYFVSKNPKSGLFERANERLAREKIGQLLRDALHAQYRSSTEAKKHRRRVELTDIDIQMTRFIQNNPTISFIIDSVAKHVNANDLTDRQVAELFNEANANILEELKRFQGKFC
mmetsp:Transcript_12229/g.28338  ORF Transcript_12229/g.28338 Transcript_12229/m.28338 type:complete len:189 (+) Transcript_12229:3-569(+)